VLRGGHLREVYMTEGQVTLASAHVPPTVWAMDRAQ
jgi:hypothetical protein